MTEQPKRLKLHQRAMQVIPEWMEKWGVRIPKAEMWNDPYCPPAKEVLCDLRTRFKAAFQAEEDTLAALLAACEKLANTFDEISQCPSRAAATEDHQCMEREVLAAARAAVAQAKETDNG